MSSHLRRAGRREIGGILFGEQLEPGKFRLVDFTVDEVTGGAAHFCRSPENHRGGLKSFYAKTGHDFQRYNYLGEWHSHPRFSVYPSTQDCQSMLDLVHSEEGISFAVLLIVRLDWFWVLKSSAVMFSCFGESEPVTIERL